MVGVGKIAEDIRTKLRRNRRADKPGVYIMRDYERIEMEETLQVLLD